jgi:hypothetical protein
MTSTGTDWRTRLDGDKARRCRHLCGTRRLRQAEAGCGGAIRPLQRHSLERSGVPDYEPSGGRAGMLPADLLKVVDNALRLWLELA